MYTQISHQFASNIPGLLLWEKDMRLNFTAANKEAAMAFGHSGDVDKMLGTSDYDFPCRLSEFADVFRANDQYVMQERKTVRFLEIQPFADDEWKVLVVVKSPTFDKDGHVTGTIGYATDVSGIYTNVPKMVAMIQHPQKKDMEQRTYVIKSAYNKISKQQNECIFYLVRGKTTREISERLKLSPKTVEHYIDAIKMKFKCSNKYELIVKLIELGFLHFIPDSILRQQLSLMF